MQHIHHTDELVVVEDAGAQNTVACYIHSNFRTDYHTQRSVECLVWSMSEDEDGSVVTLVVVDG